MSLAFLPIPLAYFVDMTYHWLLIVSIPGGILLAIIFLIIWAVMKTPDAKNKEEIG